MSSFIGFSTYLKTLMFESFDPYEAFYGHSGCLFCDLGGSGSDVVEGARLRGFGAIVWGILGFASCVCFCSQR